MNKIKNIIILSTLLLAQPVSGFAEGQNDMFGVWGSLTLQGDFNALSPGLNKFK